MRNNSLAKLVMLLVMGLLLITKSSSLAQDNSPNTFVYNDFTLIGRGTLFSIAWRPDARALAVVSSSGIWLYDDHLQDIQHINEENVAYIAWRPDSTMLAVSRVDQGIALYDVSKQPARFVRFVTGSTLDRAPLAWSPDGKFLASFAYLRIDSSTGTSIIKLYDVERDTSSQMLPLPDKAEVESIVWSPDGQHIAVNIISQLLVFNRDSGDLEASWDVGVKLQLPIWSPDGKVIAVFGLDGSLYMLNRADKSSQRIALVPEEFWRAASWSADSVNGITLAGERSLLTHAGDTLQITTLPSPLALAALSADSTKLASYSEDYVLTIRDIASNATVATDERFSARLNMATWSPDGTQIAAGYREGEGRIWDAATGSVVAKFPQNSSDIVWSPDSRFIATTNPYSDFKPSSNALDIRDTQTWQVVRSISGVFVHLAWSSDSQLIAGVDAYQQKIGIIDATNGSVLKSIPVNSRGIASLAWSPDQRFVAAALVLGVEGPIEAVGVWDVNSGERRYLVSATSPASWSNDGKLLATTSGTFLSLREAATGLPVKVIQFRPFAGSWDRNAGMAWSASGTRLAVTQQDTLILDPTSGILLSRLPSAIEGIGLEPLGYDHRMDWTQDGMRLLMAQPDGVMMVWQAEPSYIEELTKLPMQEMPLDSLTPTPTALAQSTPIPTSRSQVTAAIPSRIGLREFQNDVQVSSTSSEVTTWSPTGKYLLVSGTVGDGERAGVFDIAAGQEILPLPSVLSGSWSLDEHRLAIMIDNGDATTTLQVWSIDQRRMLWSSRGTVGDDHSIRTTKPPTPSVIAFSPDGTRLAERRLDGMVILYDAQIGHIVSQIQAVNRVGRLGLMKWGEVGDTLIVSMAEDGLQLWNVQRPPSLIATFYNYTGGVNWSHDGQQVAVGTDLTRVFVYDAHTGRLLYVLNGHENQIADLGWSPDDRYLFSYSIYADGPVPTGIAWDMATRQIAARVVGTDYITDVNWTQTGLTNRLMVANIFRNIFVWDADNNRTSKVDLPEPQPDEFGFVPAVLSADGHFLALTVAHGKDYVLEIRDAGSGDVLTQTTLPPIPEDKNWRKPVWSPDNQHLYMSWEWRLYVYQLGGTQ